MKLNRRALLACGAASAALAGPARAVTSMVRPLTYPTSVLVNAASRDGVDLSGAWRYSIDPYRDGLFGFHGAAAGFGHQRFDERDVDAFTRANPNALMEYDMHRSEQTVLPSSWITQDPTLRHYDGLMWYQRTFTITRSRGQRAFVYVGAANYKSWVYVNGQLAGQHEGGFTPFSFEITDVLRNGENNITIGVDADQNWDTVPPQVTDWENYGGVTRAVRIVLTPAAYIDDAWVRLTADGRISANMRVVGASSRSQTARVRIPSLGLAIECQSDDGSEWAGAAAAPAGLQLWSPDSPTLYDVVFEAAGDALSDRVGFRTIEVRGEDILLNGAPIFLRGVCLHEEEFGAEPTRAITPAAARALLSEAKEGLNCNFVRLAHYPHSEIMTRTADEMGLLVWSEVPVYWRINWTNSDTLATARRMLAENILRDRNRASIILWSVANETPISDERNAFLQTLIGDVRALDDTRLVTAALMTNRREERGRPIMVLNDPLADHLDVLGVNTYNGWYSDDALSDLPRIGWESPYGKPMIFSEFGADALAGFYEPQLMRKFSEDFQAEYHRQTLEMSKSISFLRGLSPWILKDFRAPRRQHPVYQQGWNRKGFVSPTGQRKMAFPVLSDHYRWLAQTWRRS